MFGESVKDIVITDLPFFVPSELFWGFGLIIFSILFSFFLWRQKMGLSGKGIFFWLLNLAIFIFALMKISSAFPRLPFAITFGLLLVLVFVVAGSAFAVNKKEGSGGEKKEGGETASK